LITFDWDSKNSHGKLDHVSGTASFTAAKIARKKVSPNVINYLKWTKWSVDFGTVFSYALFDEKDKFKHSGSMSQDSAGTGDPGGLVLTGTMPNQEVTSKWSNWS